MCVDDFSRFTWVDFITEKSDTFDVFRKLCEKIKNEENCNIVIIMSDHGREFKTLVLKNIVIYMEFHMSFPQLLLHNKMAL